MTIDRRKLLAGLSGLAATTALPAWGQAIRSQSDPWAQVDPYADPRNGFAATPRAPEAGGAFEASAGRPGLAGADRDEIATGTRLYQAEMRSQGGLHPDPAVQKAIRDFAAPFFRGCERPDLPWEVHVVRTQAINAWALPGGKLCFYAGILGMCDHPGELAAILCHEMGHVLLHHSMIGGDTAKAAAEAARQNPAILGNVRIGTLIEGADRAGINNNLDLLMTGLTRDNEDAADAYGVELLRKMRIDPRWAAVMLGKLGQVEKAAGGEHVHDLLLDHAHPRDRMAHVLTLAGGRDPSMAVNFPAMGWDRLKIVFPTASAFRNKV